MHKNPKDSEILLNTCLNYDKLIASEHMAFFIPHVCPAFVSGTIEGRLA